MSERGVKFLLFVAGTVLIIAMLLDAAKKQKADATINRVLDTVNRGIDVWAPK